MKPASFRRQRALLSFLGVICFLAVAGCGSSSSGTGAITGPTNNTAPVIANAGPPVAGGEVDVLFVTVTVCQHGTSNCAAIDNVKVDTASIGLRLAEGTLGSVTLTPIMVGGSALEECIQYGDTSYSWGPMELADVEIAGEKATNVPVQLLGATTATPPSASSPTANGASCIETTPNSNLPGTPAGNEDTVATLGANGILGIAGFTFDCGSACTTVSIKTGYPYYTCPGGTCEAVGVPTADQSVNVVAEFASDNNGVMITLPDVPAMGAVTVSGTMTFGIGTQTDNALGSAVIYAMDACAAFPTVRFNGVSYTDGVCSGTGSGLGGLLDTGSNGLFVSDASTLASEGFGISDCAQFAGFYCVTSGGTAILSSVRLVAFGGAETAIVSLNIRDAASLFTTNNAVFNDIGGGSGGTGPSTDSFDLGLPFFLGKTVFVGIAGQAVPGGVNAPNGFVAF